MRDYACGRDSGMMMEEFQNDSKAEEAGEQNEEDFCND